MADVNCIVTVGPGDTVALRFEGQGPRYRAPLQHPTLTRTIVRRLDSLITRMPGETDAERGYAKDDLCLLGAVLFDILFGGPAVLLLDERPDEAFNLGKSLGHMLDTRLRKFESAHTDASSDAFRISLSFNDDVRLLGSYPWELLFVERDDGSGFFLGEKTILSRMLSPLPLLAVPDRLEVWLAWSQPSELGPIRGTSVLKNMIERSLDASIVTEFPEVTLADLVAMLQSNRPKPDILHLVAHGQLVASDSQIALRRTPEQLAAARKLAGPQPRSDVGQADWTPITTLAKHLEACPPRLVFLHACNLGRPAPGVEAFKGAAETLARAGIPFVVAMQYEIEVAEAELFATAFYEALGKASTVDDAVKAGRHALGHPEWKLRRFGTPVVFLRSENARLVQESRIRPQKSTLVALQDCPFEGCAAHLKARGRHCGCPRQLPFKLCDAGHANDPAADICWLAACDKTFARPAADGKSSSRPPGVPRSPGGV